MSERDQLLQELDVKIAMLTKNYLEAKNKAEKLASTLDLMKEQNELLKKNIHEMKTAKVFSIGKNDLQETHKTISRLILEIDKCIAQLSI